MHLSTPDAKASSPQSQITIVAEYGSAIAQVTQPLSYVAMSHYYVSRWAAEVGGTGTLLILNLRALGYWNPTTQEMRGDITISLPELAKRCGVSVNTIKRELATNTALQRFVRKEPQYRRDRTGEVYRMENAYHIRMDDPLHPSDEPKVQEIVEAMQKGSLDGMAQNGRGRKRVKAQYDTSQGQSGPGGVQSERAAYQTDTAPVKTEPGGVQNGLTLKNHSGLLPITQNTQNTAAPPPRVYHSVIDEEKDRLRRRGSLTEQELIALGRKVGYIVLLQEMSGRMEAKAKDGGDTGDMLRVYRAVEAAAKKGGAA